MVLYVLVSMSVSVMFHLTYVQNISVRSRLLSVQCLAFGEGLSGCLTICSLCIISVCNSRYFILGLRAGFGFRLPKFLVIAYLFLLVERAKSYALDIFFFLS